MKSKTFAAAQASALGALILTGCAAAPQRNELLEHARVVVSSAQSDPDVAGEAHNDLVTAVAALNQGDAMQKAGKPVADVDHEAYLAERFALAAQKGAQLSRSEKSIANADSRRNSVLLAAREQETVRANDRANTKTLEADAARADALASAQVADSARLDAQASAQANAAAQQHAQELADALSDLQAKKTDRGLVITLGDVLFSTGRADMKPGAQRSLDKLSNFLHQYPQRNVQIEGFTDSVGTDDYNQGLSERRADAVRDQLTGMGIARDRIQTRGLGKSNPVAENDSASGRQQNRRVEVIISESDGRTATR
jgi:outer membrane protein OmpA-like peptidoglycan-associated protein